MSEIPSVHALVLKDLRRGLGAEDIARRYELSVTHIRTVIADLRNWGIIAGTDRRDARIPTGK